MESELFSYLHYYENLDKIIECPRCKMVMDKSVKVCIECGFNFDELLNNSSE